MRNARLTASILGLAMVCLCGFAGGPAASAANAAPGEWAPLSEFLLGCTDPGMVIDTYIDTVRGLGSACPISIICSSNSVVSELRYEFSAAGLNTASVRYYLAAVDSVWMRDYGPMFTHDSLGKVVVVDSQYYPGRPNDDQIPYKFARFRGFGYTTLALYYEGGNMMSDGNGRLTFSKDTYAENSGKAQSTVNSMMLSKLGGTRISTFKPLINDGTGHIDMYAKFFNSSKVLVSDYPAGHYNKATVDWNAAQFAALGYTVVRAMTAVAHDPFATYANSVYVNGYAVIPQYGRPEDAAGLAVYTAAGFHAVGVDCADLIQYSGAIHCITMGVPKPKSGT
ncbi:MAG: agmatine deiminase family protein [Planctomycetes bacterium]|nr:agmatine deiminase family protein [Planctomycetota bacterium]